MYKYILILAFITCLPFFNYAQDYNLQLISNLDYDAEGNDIWGYEDNQGTEYAIMGLTNGTSIVSLATPSNPVEVTFIPGGNSTWRDMKSYGDYVYVTTEAADGILVVDMSDAANGNITHSFYTPNIQFGGVNGVLQTIHNLYIDENGFCYISGANLNNGGVLIFDLNQNPVSPPLVGVCENIYSHDAFTRNDTLWSSNVNDGHFSVIDVSDKSNPVTLAYQETSFTFSHNAWLSDNSSHLFTTDELPNANIDAYDVSDITNIQRVDTWVPKETQGTGVVPHNVHVFNDYLVISYYTDGLKILDAARPHNLIEVGSYDTYLQGGGGTNGCWGAYPFLDSGIILASDIVTGLYVFQPNYIRACYLEGNVTDAGTGLPINGANITLSSGLEETTPSNGQYATGQVSPGTFQATYSKVGYVSQTVDIILVNGQLTIQDIALIEEAVVQVSGQVIDAADGEVIPNAAVRILNESNEYITTADANGNFIIADVFQGEYTVYAGSWGYHTKEAIIDAAVANANTIIMELTAGYSDPFAVDLGWTEDGDASSGAWEIGEPIGTFTQGAIVNPEEDVDGDIGNWAYVTGNGGGGAGFDDVDGGTTTLSSPLFDLTDYSDPFLSYQIWFRNGGGDGNANDEVFVVLGNGNTEVTLETLTSSLDDWSDVREFKITDFITLTDNMTLSITTSDMPNSGHLVEAGFDNFIVYENPETPTVNINNLSFEINPNPFTDYIQIQIPAIKEDALVSVYDILGKLVYQETISNNDNISINSQAWASGVYQVVLTSGNNRGTVKMVKR